MSSREPPFLVDDPTTSRKFLHRCFICGTGVKRFYDGDRLLVCSRKCAVIFIMRLTGRGKLQPEVV